MLADHDDLAAALDAHDAHDQERGCTAQRDAREVARVAESEESAQARAAHGAMTDVVDQVLGDIPKPCGGRADLDAWLRDAEVPARTAGTVPSDLVDQATKRIETRLTRKGFGPGAAGSVAARLGAALNSNEVAA